VVEVQQGKKVGKTKVKTTWAGGMRFVSESDSGHSVVTDVSKEAGGGETAPSPVELVLVGLAACTGVDIASILEKMRVPLESLEILAEAERAEEHPRVFTRIRLKYRVGGNVPEKKFQKAISLSAKTYCSVGAMLDKTATIHHEYSLQNSPELPPESP
jgi:putative redox protein